MIRHVLIFVIATSIGAFVALALRSALHQPYAAPASPAPATPAPAADPHAGHASTPTTVPTPVNTICAICGMKPDPRLAASYQGKPIAFGCKACPDEFSKDPDRYGPYFLRSEEAP
jgi:hypothetical protein